MDFPQAVGDPDILRGRGGEARPARGQASSAANRSWCVYRKGSDEQVLAAGAPTGSKAGDAAARRPCWFLVHEEG